MCVAVALPPPLGIEVDAARAALDPGRRHMVSHVTLVAPFRPDDPVAALAHVTSVARACPAFAVTLSGSGTFRPSSPTVFLAVSKGAQELAGLRAGLVGGLVAPERQPYVPHVTVATRLSAEALDEAQQRFAAFEASFEVLWVTWFERGEQGWAAAHEVPLGEPVIAPSTSEPLRQIGQGGAEPELT